MSEPSPPGYVRAIWDEDRPGAIPNLLTSTEAKEALRTAMAVWNALSWMIVGSGGYLGPKEEVSSVGPWGRTFDTENGTLDIGLSMEPLITWPRPELFSEDRLISDQHWATERAKWDVMVVWYDWVHVALKTATHILLLDGDDTSTAMSSLPDTYA